jgi:DNA-binding LacI/PurR family transcriptional regulator
VIGNPQRPTWHSVDNDNVGAAYMATTHLIKQGHKAIGFLAGPAGLAVTEERTKGYLAALEEHNMPGHVWNCDFGHSAAHCKTSDLIADGLLMPAYLVMDDYMATGFIKAVQEAGFQIPSDCAITSFNDSSLCHLLPHGLTSVNMGVPALVQMAVDQLIAIVESKEHLPARRTLVACELKIRGSSRSGGQP